MTVKVKGTMCRDSIASETDLQNAFESDGSPEIADELDEVYWSQLLDDAYRMQLEIPDVEISDVDEALEP
jgi:hypothetical protein